MTIQFDTLKQNRKLILKIIESFSLAQLNKIPEGFTNNIAWNLGHLLVTQQLLCYKFSGIQMMVNDEMISKFMKGSSPKEAYLSEEIEEVKKLFLTLPQQLEDDYNKGVFKNYEEYTTSLNVTLTDIDAAIAFNGFHEGIHLGVILSLRKLV